MVPHLITALTGPINELEQRVLAGIPGILEDIQQWYVRPPLHAGWPTRRKSTHFVSYEKIAERMGQLLAVDPWLIYVVGGFYRVHATRTAHESLNTPEADYVPLAFEHSTQLPQLGMAPGRSSPNRFYMYGVISRLAMLAASYELEATDPLREDFE